MNQRLKSGYISIKRKRFWVDRYVEVYSDKKLYYYYNQGDSNPRGVFDLEQAVISLRKSKDSPSDNVIQIHTGRDVIQITSDYQKEFQAWYDLITKLSKKKAQLDDQLSRAQSIQNDMSTKFQEIDDDELQNIQNGIMNNTESLQTKIIRPFVFDKQVIQERFQGDEQLMLKANTSFFISEFKNMVLTNVDQGMKIFMCKMGLLKEKTKEEHLKNPKKEIREWALKHVISLKESIGIPLFCLIFIVIFLLFFIIFYMLFEIFNTSSLIFSFLACMNLFTLPYVFLQAKKKKKAIQNQIFRIKVQARFPQNLNQFLFALQQQQDRIHWHPNAVKCTVQKETVSLQLSDFEFLTNEIFQLTIYTESKYLYIVEHQKSLIFRIFQINYQEAQYNSFEMTYYSKVSGPNYKDVTLSNSVVLIKSLSQYIADQRLDKDSQLFNYMIEQQKNEQKILEQQEKNFQLKSNIIEYQSKNSISIRESELEFPTLNNKNSSRNQSYVSHLNLEDSEVKANGQIPEKAEEEEKSQMASKNQSTVKQINVPPQASSEQGRDSVVDENQKYPNVDQSKEKVKQELIAWQSKKLDGPDQIYQDRLDEILSDFKRIMPLSDVWNVEQKKGTFSYHTRDDLPLLHIRVEETFNVPMKDAIAYIANVQNRKFYDEMFDLCEEIRHITPYLKILRNQMKKVMIVAGRDFVVLSGLRYSEDKYFILARSYEEFDEVHPPPKKIVRGNMLIAGWCLEKLSETQVRGVFLGGTDLRGGMPKNMYKIGCQKQADGVKKLKKNLEAQNKKQK